MYYWWYWLVIGVCAFFSMFFSAADMVYGIVDQERLKKLDKKRAKVALDLAENYEFSISTILFGNNVANILMSSLVTIIVTYYQNEAGMSHAVILGNIILSVAIIIFCEFIPKAVAKRFNFSLSLLFAYPVKLFQILFFIFTYPVSKLFELFGRLFTKRSKEEDVIDEEVLSEMVDQIEEDGMLEEGEAELVRSAIDFNDVQAFEVMTPRVDVFAIDVEDDINEIIKEGEIFKHSRIPVYEETIDNIIGILPIKAVAKCLLADKPIDVKSLIYQPIVVPRNHELIDMLEEFKKSKIHIAVVKDEYGGTEGIVTMEDVLEEIVGDIFDETDEIEEEYIKVNDDKYIVDGLMNIDDFFELIDYKEEFETDYSTAAGFCQEILDRFAKVGDEFDFSHYHFKVLEATEFTVEKLEVNILPLEEDE